MTTEGLPDALRRLTDQLADAPRPGVVVIAEDHHGLVQPGDIYASREMMEWLHDVDVDLCVLCSPMDADTVTAVFREWDWRVIHEAAPTRPAPHGVTMRPFWSYGDGDGNAIVAIALGLATWALLVLGWLLGRRLGAW